MCDSRENPSKEVTISSFNGEGVLSDGEDGKDGELDGLGYLWPASRWSTGAGRGKFPLGRLEPFPRDFPLFLRELDGPGILSQAFEDKFCDSGAGRCWEMRSDGVDALGHMDHRTISHFT